MKSFLLILHLTPSPMKRVLLASALLLLSATSQAADQPNVIIIYGDDVGFADLGVYGSTMIPTPNLDQLAAEGLRFTDGHCAAATCTPSRYSMLTGSMAFRKAGTGILSGTAKMAIGPDQYTIADLFKQAGYKTGVIGKWHLGLGDGDINWNEAITPGPLEIGFDYSFILPATNDRVPSVYMENRHIINLDPEDPLTVSYGKPVPDNIEGTEYPDAKVTPEAMTYYPSSHGHNHSVINGIGRIGYMKGGKSALFKDEDMADDFVNKAKAFIEESKDEPFFLFFSSQDIHVPRTPHPRFHGKSQLGYRGDAMVQLDWSTGAIMKALKKAGIDDNTIVIFSSDNGPVYDDGYQDGTTVRTSTQESDRGHDGSGPYSGGKYQIFEGGTRVPLIVRWPAKVEPGVSKALVSQVDLVASFAEMLNQETPEGAAGDSRSTLAAFLGKTDIGSEIILEQAKGVALRMGDWKYFEPKSKNKKGKAGAKETPEGQLFNLADDIGEKNNVFSQNPEIAEKMAKLLSKYREQGLAE